MYVSCFVYVIFFFKQKTAYEMRISDWSSDVCSSDLPENGVPQIAFFFLLDDKGGVQSAAAHLDEEKDHRHRRCRRAEIGRRQQAREQRHRDQPKAEHR